MASEFSGALATWRDVNLSELQKTLDEQGVQVVENQKESVIGRKALADKTKDFKKIPDNEKLTAFKGLLKAYQTEIDSLTKRSKTSENAFLNVYKVLAEAPDPYPLLEAAVDQTIKVAEARDLEDELKRLRDENAELKRKVNDFSSVETAKTKAEAKVVQLESKMEDIIQEKTTQKANELNATYDEKLRNYAEREQDLLRQVTLTKNQLRDLRTSNDSNQAKLLDQTQKQDMEVVAKLAEMDMMVADLERANGRVATVERRNELLRAEIESMKSGGGDSDKVKALERQIEDLELEVERLSRSLESQKQAFTESEYTWKKKVEEAGREVTKKTAEIEQLKTKLKTYSDYDEIKRELEIMKYVEFAGLEEEEEEDSTDPQLPNPNADKTNNAHVKSLETLLATKNKKLLEELTKFRILHGELESTLQEAQTNLTRTTEELGRQKDLNEKLENDLLSLNTSSNQEKDKENGDAWDDMDSNHGKADSLATLDLGRKMDGSNSKSPDGSTRTTPIPFNTSASASSADSSILPIVTSQRDRFRQRNAELEEELRKQFHSISELRSEMKNLQADNLKLYEKVRYMQSYSSSSGARPLTSQLDPLPSSSNAPGGAGGGGSDLGKYQVRYEQSMNPFEAFRGREATRAYESLNRLERGVLILTRAILSNRRTRTFFICYALALHALVLFTSYECASSSTQHLEKQRYP